MPLLTRRDIARHSTLAWLCLLALAAMAWWLEEIGRGAAAEGSLAALLGCLGLLLPPRERMAGLPRRLRLLPRRCDAAPVLASLLSAPGYALHLFERPGPYDEAVHLASGLLAGWVLAELLATDGRPRSRRGMALRIALAGLALGLGWEGFEWAVGIMGDAADTLSDIALTAGGAALAGALLPPRRMPAGAPAR